MKNLKIKFGLLGLMLMFGISMLITSCQQEELIDTEILELEQQSTDNQQDPFMTELINSTSSQKIKQWLTTDFSKEADPEAAVKLFASFSIEEAKEASEMITKLESHVFENYIAEEFNMSEADRIIARQENADAAAERQRLNERAESDFGKTMWSLERAEMETLTVAEISELESRGCNSRKRIFDRSSSITSVKRYNSNCKASYDVKACSGWFYGYSGCASDCDWEFRFDGKKTKHRIVYSWDFGARQVLARAIDVGIRAVHGNNLGMRYQFWGGKWHTYLQVGYPDQLGSNIGTTIGRSTLKGYLSMHGNG